MDLCYTSAETSMEGGELGPPWLELVLEGI